MAKERSTKNHTAYALPNNFPFYYIHLFVNVATMPEAQKQIQLSMLEEAVPEKSEDGKEGKIVISSLRLQIPIILNSYKPFIIR